MRQSFHRMIFHARTIILLNVLPLCSIAQVDRVIMVDDFLGDDNLASDWKSSWADLRAELG